MAPILLFSYHLAPEVARHIRDMNPTTIALPNELSEAYLSLLMHLNDKLKQLAVVCSVPCNNVGSATKEVVTILHAPDERVEFLAAVARGHHDGFAPRFADGV